MMLILDDHPVVREGLLTILHMQRPEEQFLQAGNVSEAISQMQRNPVDMVFVDVNLGQESGFDFLNWMQDHKLPARSFMITSSSRESDFLQAQELGVDAYVLKDSFIDDIVYGLNVVERGGRFYSTAVMERMSRSERKKDDQATALMQLTEREMEVLTLISSGCTNGTIASQLFISEGTVKKHVSGILDKLNLKNRAEAMLYVTKNQETVNQIAERWKCKNTRRERR